MRKGHEVLYILKKPLFDDKRSSGESSILSHDVAYVVLVLRRVLGGGLVMKA
jgi:hypothetical protein